MTDSSCWLRQIFERQKREGEVCGICPNCRYERGFKTSSLEGIDTVAFKFEGKEYVFNRQS